MNAAPNILLITSDQQHWNTLGIDNPEIRTPNLDRLARQGTLFERAYCPNPTCTPTRASILTGQWPSQHGAYSLGTKLAEDRPTVNDVWRTHGYRTGLVGKAHFQPLKSTPEYPSLESYPQLQDLDFWRTYAGPFYGFDDFELARNHTDEAHVGQHYALWMEDKGFKEWRACFQKPTGQRDAQKHRWNIPEDYHYNTWISERTNHHLAQRARDGRPFFLWASFFDPHPSYLVPEPWDRMYDPQAVTVPQGRTGEHANGSPFHRMAADPVADYAAFGVQAGRWMHGVHSHVHDRAQLGKDIAVYYGMVSFLDQSVGRILDRLDALNLAENTLVVFTSDHGHYYGHHGLVAKGPFHYEDGVRVPMLVRWPGRVPAGARSQALQSLLDLPPTMLEAAGIPAPRFMSGLNQLPAWTEGKPVRAHTLVENTHEPGTVELRTYIDQRYKITVYRGRECGELYDLEADPTEFENRWDDPSFAAIKTRLLHEFVQAEMARDILPMPRVSAA